jgi:hypothetical protein
MRVALRQNAQRRPVSIEESITVPDEGWDAVSPLTDMGERRAIMLQNWTARPGYVEVRKGNFSFATAGSAVVESLMVYRATVERMFAASGTVIYNVTAGGAGVSVVTAMTNARWQYVNFATTGGQFLVCCNGVDVPRQYTGGTDTWAASTITGAGLTPATLIDVMAHKKRLYFIEVNSLHIWYLPVGAVTGTAVLFDLGPIFTEGGNLLCMGTWTFDGGNGVDDYAVFITDQGQVAVYQGDDPSTAASWALVGIYQIGFPLSRRAILKTGGDLAVITSDGIVPLSVALRTDRAASERIALSARIQNEFAKAVTAYKANYGWEGISYPGGNLAIFNIPIITDSSSMQFVVNVLTGSWAKWISANATVQAVCFALFNDVLYCGAVGGNVFRCDYGSTDNGTPITAELKGAFHYYRRKNQQKHFKMARPIFYVSGNIAPAVEMDVDFQNVTPTATPTVVSPSALALWDSALWDTGVWADSLQLRNDWTTVLGIGVCGAIHMLVTISAGSASSAVNSTVQYIGCDCIYEPGGYL